MEAKKIAVIVGSLRKESYNRKLAGVLFSVVPETLKLEFVEIGSLPLYNEDLDINPPAEWQDFRNKMKTFQGTIFVTPEYNRSIPGVLKKPEAILDESFMYNNNEILEYPQYTKPVEFRGLKVPAVLTQGNHQKIAKWRIEHSGKKKK